MPAVALAAATSLADQPVVAMVALVALGLLPFAFMTLTSFAKISVVLSLLRNALGTGQVPSGTIILGLSALLTVYVMAPVGQRIVEVAGPAAAKVQLAGSQGASARLDALFEAVDKGKEPLREFLVHNAAPKEQSLFFDLARRARRADPTAAAAVAPTDFLVAAPAFLITELSEAFRIGFLVFIPFLVVDMVVANVLLALGMHMLSPTTVSLPFKLLLFVLVDGWLLLARALVLGYV